jgi:hypothetical protein
MKYNYQPESTSPVTNVATHKLDEEGVHVGVMRPDLTHTPSDTYGNYNQNSCVYKQL